MKRQTPQKAKTCPPVEKQADPMWPGILLLIAMAVVLVYVLSGAHA